MKEFKYWDEIKGIGKLNKEIDLVVGNEPVLFVCSLEERPAEKYLVMTYNLFKGKYVIRKITPQELLLMLENKITMEQTFRNGKEIIMTYYKGCDLCAEKYNSKDFAENLLPKKGAYYEIHSKYILNYIDDIRKDAIMQNYQKNNNILEKVNAQIKETIEQYPSLSLNDIKVYLKDELICFQMKDFLHEETVANFATAYVNEKKVDYRTAVALNTADLLGKMDGIMCRRKKNKSMKYDNIRHNLVNTINEIAKEIYSLDEFSQAQIFNADILPEEPSLLFLNNSYYSLNEILSNLNKL